MPAIVEPMVGEELIGKVRSPPCSPARDDQVVSERALRDIHRDIHVLLGGAPIAMELQGIDLDPGVSPRQRAVERANKRWHEKARRPALRLVVEKMQNR